MDLQTGLISVGVVVLSAAVILFVSMFGMKEKSYEEAIAEQRKLPDDLLLGKYKNNSLNTASYQYFNSSNCIFFSLIN